MKPIKVNEDKPSAIPSTETGNVTLKAALSCGKCYVKTKVTNPGIAGGHIENEIVFCSLHAAAPALYDALKRMDALIENLWRSVPWGKTAGLDIQALNEVPTAAKRVLSLVEGRQ